MIEAEEIQKSKKFESYVKTLPGDDIFSKTEKVDEILKSGVMTGNEGLGMISEEKVQGKYRIKEKSGKVHSVIMLGSNSYLNLSTNPEVMNAARNALEEFGYGMGAVSNYAGITEFIKNWKNV